MTNIKCKGGKEIDLLAINPKTLERYHVEARASISPSFAVREKDTYTSKGRAHKRGLDYFSKEKFNHPAVVEKIREFFEDSDYHRILAVWNYEFGFGQFDDVAEDYGIEVLELRSMIRELMKRGATRGSRDDVLRLMELMSIMTKEHENDIERETIYKLRDVGKLKGIAMEIWADLHDSKKLKGLRELKTSLEKCMHVVKNRQNNNQNKGRKREVSGSSKAS